jgi:hypothetical protein
VSRLFLVLFFTFVFSVNASTGLAGNTLSNPQSAATSQKLLSDALNLFNNELRNKASGQYYDAVNLGANSIETNSSTAATGMGLVTLAIGDSTGDITDANIKTVQTLSALLNPKFSKRHSQGWFRHWFKAEDGADNAWSAADGYSTIDTAILAAGAVLNANYFKARNKDPEGLIAEFSDRLLLSVNWSSAISDSNAGRLFMNFDLNSEAPKKVTLKFNEYILVSCMGKLAESKRGVRGPMTDFWQRHFANPDSLPKKVYQSQQGPLNILTDHPFHYLSSFTIQFAYYLCSDVSTNDAYITYLKNAQKMDKDWFVKQPGNPLLLWGSGAGEAVRGYEANSVMNNTTLIVSPHIVAGFLAESPSLINDLLKIYSQKEFVYTHNGKEILWRRSLTNPDKALSRLQAVDFSTMIFGLASLQPGITSGFFKKFAAGSN